MSTADGSNSSSSSSRSELSSRWGGSHTDRTPPSRLRPSSSFCIYVAHRVRKGNVEGLVSKSHWQKCEHDTRWHTSKSSASSEGPRWESVPVPRGPVHPSGVHAANESLFSTGPLLGTNRMQEMAQTPLVLIQT
ncbi:unnamed protein product [Pleuronectes platessa]|uniref:Uncharacterized protein n=1 Tax=Pleuronectes platessa TaxID=8262 RepID=A0A9N7UL94_PLEPL|nr:unnamed protein product [Pleuronectes platessa]